MTNNSNPFTNEFSHFPNQELSSRAINVASGLSALGELLFQSSENLKGQVPLHDGLSVLMRLLAVEAELIASDCERIEHAAKGATHAE